MHELYRFPSNLRAASQDAMGQACKGAEESFEVFRTLLDGEDAERTIEECWDAIQAYEGLLRKYPFHMVEAGYAGVIAKGCKRGDYR